jgi:hypothetical protein
MIISCCSYLCVLVVSSLINSSLVHIIPIIVTSTTICYPSYSYFYMGFFFRYEFQECLVHTKKCTTMYEDGSVFQVTTSHDTTIIYHYFFRRYNTVPIEHILYLSFVPKDIKI